MMQYRCTAQGGYQVSGEDFVNNANSHMTEMASQGWRLVAATSYGNQAVVYLFWEKE